MTKLVKRQSKYNPLEIQVLRVINSHSANPLSVTDIHKLRAFDAYSYSAIYRAVVALELSGFIKPRKENKKAQITLAGIRALVSVPRKPWSPKRRRAA